MLSPAETGQRLYGLMSAWRESPYYSGRERAALARGEAVTNVPQLYASGEEYEAARAVQRGGVSQADGGRKRDMAPRFGPVSWLQRGGDTNVGQKGLSITTTTR